MKESSAVTLLLLLLIASPCLGKGTPKATLEEQIVANEKRVIWEAVAKKQVGVLRDALAEDYLDVSDVGVFNKSETLQLIPELNLRDYTLDKFKVVRVDSGSAIVTYEAVQHWTLKGQEGSSHVRASSVWARRGGRWLIVFHQESTLG
jgi:hypothetical protein